VGHEPLENEWYIVIKAYEFTVFEIFRFFVLLYSASMLLLHMESKSQHASLEDDTS